jgi:hypothetical protein
MLATTMVMGLNSAIEKKKLRLLASSHQPTLCVLIGCANFDTTTVRATNLATLQPVAGTVGIVNDDYAQQAVMPGC